MCLFLFLCLLNNAIFMTFCTTSELCIYQDNFIDIDKNEIDQVVLDFATNREKFKAFGCRMIVDKESSAVDPRYAVDDAHFEYRFCIFDDSKKKKYRTDWQLLNLSDSLTANSRWGTLYKPAGPLRLFLNDIEVTGERPANLFKAIFLPPDPWCMTITDYGSLAKNRAEPLYWMYLFDRKKLLWAQENSRFLRAEWDVGVQSRFQVYFDRQQNNLPVYCRYFIPVSKDDRFGKKFTKFLNEVETKWSKLGDGWVPSKVRNNRENLHSSGKITHIETISVELEWETKYIEDGNIIDDKVFEVQLLDGDTLIHSFRRKR